MKPIKVVTEGKDNHGKYIREFIIVDIVPTNDKLVYLGIFRTIYTDQAVQQKMIESGRAGWSVFETRSFNMNGRVSISTFEGELPIKFNHANPKT